jgi:tetratricopeptide (TPR) repeat protein
MNACSTALILLGMTSVQRPGTRLTSVLLCGLFATGFQAAHASMFLGNPRQLIDAGTACGDEKETPAKRLSNCTLVLNKVLMTDGDTAKVLHNRANALLALGRPEEAFADFTRAIALDPFDYVAYSGRATLDLTTNRLDLAIADLSMVLRPQPSDQATFYNRTVAYYNRGIAYERKGEFEKAADDYRTAVRLLPTFAPAQAALAVLLSRTSDADAALPALNAALQLDPHSAALKSRATVLLSRGRPADALHDLDDIIAHDSADAIAYLNRGTAKQQLGDFDGAVADYSRSIELAPSVAAHLDRGGLYGQLQQPEQALADFNAAVKLDPQDVRALLARADANYARNDLAASLEDYTHVLGRDPRNAAVYFKRGNIRADLQEYSAACSDYSDSLRLDPNQPDVLYNRALASERMGHLTAAAEDRQRARSLALARGDGSTP